ncbi:NfeD family protein [Leifsonia sp. ZF2019]|uniref:NfeD family protein n=1 Tax=unclassified Leifsonia TaxID=2663824 RepID=UPI001CBEBCB7|nr:MULTISPECIES: NfeD family protein [unclassified Leifsonia]UAJ80624.1 NfeD family protein [Leifsonia sp. ZF2019]
MIVFLIIGGVGLALLLISMLFGELLDLLDGALSGTGLGAGLTIFGASGLLVLANDWPVGFAYLIAAAAGVVTLIGVQLLVRRFQSSEDGTPSDPSDLTGVTRTRVTPNGGEVSLDGPHELEARLAYSDEEIPAGTVIRVVESHGARVKVARLASASIPASTDPEKD